MKKVHCGRYDLPRDVRDAIEALQAAAEANGYTGCYANVAPGFPPSVQLFRADGRSASAELVGGEWLEYRFEEVWA